MTTTDKRGRLPEAWPLLVIGIPAGAVVWSGWIGLGQLCGFGQANLTGGLINWTVNISLALPFSVEAYGAYALKAGLMPGRSPETKRCRKFAMTTAIGSLVLGMIAQATYHLMAAAHDKRAPDLVIIFVSMLPVIALGLCAWLMHMTHAAKVAEAELAADQNRLSDEAQRERDHELELERLRQAERDRLREIAREEEEQRRADAERKRLERDERRRQIGADRLALPPASRGPNVSPPASGTVSAGWLHVVPPPEAEAGTPERQAMWSFWVHTIKTERRVPSGAELLTAGNCAADSSLGRRMSAKWKLIEPAKSLLAREATGS
jgi:hypothetical protein